MQFSDQQVRKEKSEHGGSIRGSRKRKRPIGVRSSMHLVLRSSKAKGRWSFRNFETEIHEILVKFSRKNHIQILSAANVGNHLHLHIQVRRRDLFRAFIRAVTSAIMMKVTGFSRWKPSPENFQFWDMRPFSRIISTWKEFLTLKAYVEVNQWEALGYRKDVARYLHRLGAVAGAGSG